jgi:hypothetical protein
LQGAEHLDGGDGLTCQLGRDIRGNDGQPQDLDVKRLPRRSHRLQILPAVVVQAQIQPMPGEGLLDGLAMAIELVADGRALE